MIAFAVWSAICCAGGFFAARLYHWHHDVLYGAYIKADECHAHIVERLNQEFEISD
jgi:hypothetical protein